LWDLENRRIIHRFAGHQKDVIGVSFTPDVRRIVSASFDNTMRVWDAEDGKELLNCAKHSNWIFGLAICFDGRHVLTGSKDWTMRLWDIDDGQELRCIVTQGEVRCVSLSPIEHKALSGGQDGKLRLWDVDQGEELSTFAASSSAVLSVGFSPNGRLALSGGCDRTVRLWDLGKAQEVYCFNEANADWVESVVFCGPHRALSAGGVRESTPENYQAGSDFAIRLWALLKAE
jgi:WD40 repeat protein